MSEETTLQGKRVRDGAWGLGTVVKHPYLGLDRFALVRFDKTPPFEYSCGANPCLVSKADLVLEEVPNA